MISHTEVLLSAMPVYILTLLGAVLRGTGTIAKEHIDGITRLVYSVLVPCFIVDKILGSESLKAGSIIFSSIALGFGMIVAGIFIGDAFGRLIGLEKGHGRRTFALASGCQNFGFNAAPVVAAAAAPVAAAKTYLVFFDWNKADLTDRARQIIGDAATARGAGVTRIEVNGYTDRSGSDQYNQGLSVRRANAVAAELLRRGVPRNEIATRGFGESNPLVPTADGVREPQNRRVEIILK
jgi:hypothetical protein